MMCGLGEKLVLLLSFGFFNLLIVSSVPLSVRELMRDLDEPEQRRHKCLLTRAGGPWGVL